MRNSGDTFINGRMKTARNFKYKKIAAAKTSFQFNSRRHDLLSLKTSDLLKVKSPGRIIKEEENGEKSRRINI